MSDTDVKYYLVNRNTVVNSIFDEIDLELYGEDSEGIILHGKDGTLMNDDNVHVYELGSAPRPTRMRTRRAEWRYTSNGRTITSSRTMKSPNFSTIISTN